MAKQVIKDAGVLKSSLICAHIATPFARAALYYLIFAGAYHCNTNYRIERPYLDMYLLMYVRKGRLHCRFENREWTVGPGQLILMDCKQPHVYYAGSDNTEFQWFHYNGPGAQAYYDHLRGQNRLLVSGLPDSTAIHINSIVQMMEAPLLNEQTASLLIHTILRDISESEGRHRQELGEVTTRVVHYLHEHFAEPVSLQQIADEVNVSKYHLIRSFKKSTDSTPYDYLLNIRIKRAMELLTDQNQSIDAISALCGFNSASHFTRSFKGIMGTTPGEFRKLHSMQTYGEW